MNAELGDAESPEGQGNLRVEKDHMGRNYRNFQTARRKSSGTEKDWGGGRAPAKRGLRI